MGSQARIPSFSVTWQCELVHQSRKQRQTYIVGYITFISCDLMIRQAYHSVLVLGLEGRMTEVAGHVVNVLLKYTLGYITIIRCDLMIRQTYHSVLGLEGRRTEVVML